ncbi:MAG: hypothetical protein FIA92_08840 [Chloroflexi bacterium]|nr:hypothetical protein [Chloroflexota bacterium]
MRATAPDRAGLAEIRGPLARALLIGLVGAAILVVVGGVLASTAGLLFVAGATGGGIGLALAGAAVPTPTGASERPPLERSAATRLAMVLACLAVLVGAFGTWLVAIAEGGALGPIDYLWQTFGPLVPAELLVAALGAAWGARAGPVVGR